MQRPIPKITIALIVVNVFIFLLETLQGGSENASTALRFGALYVPYVTERGEYWRLLTAAFLHFGPEHLGSNMLSLYMLGSFVEHALGPVLFLLVYLISGISGNLLTCGVELVLQDYSLSAGASGAIFGLLGVFLAFALLPGLKKMFPLKRVLVSVAVMLIPGLGDSSIGMTAHVGGLIGGFAATLLFYIFSRIFHKHMLQ